jgi:hypothetical protein
VNSGVPERAAQAECDRVFDNKVERASREMKRRIQVRVNLTKSGHSANSVPASAGILAGWRFLFLIIGERVCGRPWVRA